MNYPSRYPRGLVWLNSIILVTFPFILLLFLGASEEEGNSAALLIPILIWVALAEWCMIWNFKISKAFR